MTRVTLMRQVWKLLAALTIIATHAPGAEAKVVSKTVAYKDGETQLEGVLVYDDAKAGPRPGV